VRAHLQWIDLCFHVSLALPSRMVRYYIVHTSKVTVSYRRLNWHVVASCKQLSPQLCKTFTSLEYQDCGGEGETFLCVLTLRCLHLVYCGRLHCYTDCHQIAVGRSGRVTAGLQKLKFLSCRTSPRQDFQALLCFYDRC
jgi:hypothetical protein